MTAKEKLSSMLVEKQKDQISCLTGYQISCLAKDQISWLTKDQISWLTEEQAEVICGALLL